MPRAPEQLTVYNVGNDVRLKWRAVRRTLGDCPITSLYKVYSDSIADGSFSTQVGVLLDTTMIDFGAVQNTNRKFYRVVATPFEN